jgi:hypothetical protein
MASIKSVNDKVGGWFCTKLDIESISPHIFAKIIHISIFFTMSVVDCENTFFRLQQVIAHEGNDYYSGNKLQLWSSPKLRFR